MIRSLRYRLLVSASLSSVAVLSLLGLSVYAAMQHALISDFDDSMRTNARLLATMVEQNDGRIGFDFNSEQMPEFVAGESSRFFQIWRQDGTVLARSPSLRKQNLPRRAASDTLVSEINLPTTRPGRSITMSYTLEQQRREERKSSQPRTVSIMVAAEPIEVHHTLRLLGWLLTILCAAAVIIMGAGLLRVVSQGLRPVRKLATEIDSLTETDLGRQFSRAGVPDELLPVVDKLNGLMGRLEGAFTREKSFTADVAHELRTPLTGLRMTLEVCRSQPRNTKGYEMALDECRGITDRMTAMVESLLLLARSDAGQIALARQRVDLHQMISEKWCSFQQQAEHHGVAASFDLTDSLAIETDAEKLGIVIRNLLDNAVSYVDKGGQIRIATRREDADAVIEIANTGSLIPSEDAPRLFERFWRGDVARTDAVTHCGLGLSLCQRLMNLLGGQITVKTTRGGEFVAQIRIQSAS